VSFLRQKQNHQRLYDLDCGRESPTSTRVNIQPTSASAAAATAAGKNQC